MLVIKAQPAKVVIKRFKPSLRDGPLMGSKPFFLLKEKGYKSFTIIQYSEARIPGPQILNSLSPHKFKGRNHN